MQRGKLLQEQNMAKLPQKFVHVLYNLIPVLQVASGQLSQLMSEELHMPKGISIAEQSPVVKFELGPFERADDNFYRNHRYMKAVNWRNKKIRERIAGMRGGKEEREGRKTEEISHWKSLRENSQQQKTQTKRMHPTASEEPNAGFVQSINAIRNEMENMKTLSDLLTEIKAEMHKMETALTVEPFEKLLTVLEKSFSARENQNKFKPVTGINNVTYINQYQIENVFTINRLSKPREADAQIMTELTAHKMNEALEKAVNNLKEDDQQLSLPPTDMDLLDQLQKNFSRTFSHQNVSLDQMNQMSRIIDFVERYHGAVSSLKQSPGREGSRRTGGVRGRESRWKQELEGLGVLGGEEEGRPVMRRKGSVK